VVSTALAVACGSDSDSDLGKKNTGGSGGNIGGSGGGNTGGSNTGGSNTGGSNTGGSNTGGSNTGGSAGTSTGGTAGSSSGGSAGSATGGSAGSSTGGAAGSGGTKTDGGVKPCPQLASEYAAALEAAKACNPVLSVLQCTKQVNDELPCPCPTFINPANAKAAADLDDLQAAWNAQNCGAGVICPAVLCVAPTTGVCQANGSLAGKCANANTN
jgi:hypothetical protein